MGLSEQQKLLRFLEQRNDIIDQLDCCSLTKEEFLQENVRLLQVHNIRPFAVIQTFEQGMLNYQYYNTMAKLEQREYECKRLMGRQREAQFHKNKRDNYYCEKDKSLMGLLVATAFLDVEAYYIEVHSKRLQGNILEIIVKSREKAVFHTMNAKIIEVLREMNCLSDHMRLSCIDSYVNERSFAKAVRPEMTMR